MDTARLIQEIAIYALPVLFAITVHEAAHGYAARRLGDDTAWRLGRVTLNPMSHIDPIGTVLMPLMLYFATSGAFLFGYAKPVPVRFGNLNHPKRDMVWVALAGPASNFVQALAWGVLFYALLFLGVEEPFFQQMCKAGVGVNISLFVLNLFPLPPLDGGRILVGLLPLRSAMAVSRVEPYGFFIVMGLIIAGIFETIWMRPLMAITGGVVDLLLQPLSALLH